MNRVKELRLKSGMQQKQVALSIGVSRATVCDWEHQKKDPTGARLTALAELFNVSTGVILGMDSTDTVYSMIQTLTEDELILIERYRALTAEDKELLRSDALRMKRETDRGGATMWRTNSHKIVRIEDYRK